MPSGMISTPGTGCSCASLLSSASAGGQLEQPSDVKSSTTTGTRADGAGVDCAAAMINISAVSKLDLISALSTQHSALSTQHSAPSTQHPAPSTRYRLLASISIVTWISSPTTGPASIRLLYCRPKSRRLSVVVAEAPTFWPPCCVLIAADGPSTFRVTSFVTPCIVRSPISLKRPWPAASARFDLNVAVGYFATSKKFADFRSPSRLLLPVLICETSIEMSALRLASDVPS